MNTVSNAIFLRLALLLGPGLDLRSFRLKSASFGKKEKIVHRLFRFAAREEESSYGYNPNLGDFSKKELARGLWTAIREGVLEQSFPISLQFPDGSTREFNIKLDEFVDEKRKNELDQNPSQLYYMIYKKAPGKSQEEKNQNTEEAIGALQARFIDPKSGFLDRLIARIKANLQHAAWFFGPLGMIGDKDKEEVLLERSKQMINTIISNAVAKLGKDLENLMQNSENIEGDVSRYLQEVASGQRIRRYLGEQWTIEGPAGGGKVIAMKLFANALQSSLNETMIPHRPEDIKDFVEIVKDSFMQKINEVGLATLKEDDSTLSKPDLREYQRLISIVLEYLMKREGTWDDYISAEGEGLQDIGKLYDLMGHIYSELLRRAQDRWDIEARETGRAISMEEGGDEEEGASWGKMIESETVDKLSNAARKFLGLFTSWALRGEGLGENPPFLSEDEKKNVQDLVAKDLPTVQQVADKIGLSPDKLEDAKIVLRHMLVDLTRPAGDRVTWEELAHPDAAAPHKRDLVHTINPNGVQIVSQAAYSSNWRAFVQRLWLFLANYLQSFAQKVNEYQSYLESGEAEQRDIPHLVQDFLTEKSTPKRHLIDYLSESDAGRRLVKESEDLFDVKNGGGIVASLRLIAALPSIGIALNKRANKDQSVERYAGFSPTVISMEKYLQSLV